MINRQALLNDLQALLKRLEADLLDRSESPEVPEVGETLRSEYKRAKDAERTGQSFEQWRSDAITQNAAAWVLSCVFVRFLEDNRLIDPPKIAGPDERLQRARDEHEIYFRKSPTETDREYLLAVFDDLTKLPGTEDIFGEHNPIRELPAWLSGDSAGELLRFFQKIDADTGVLVHDFTSPHRRTDLQVRPHGTRIPDGPGDPSYDYYDDTRFLGDLYQDLSESARKKYALLQTPEFVEEFILDRTLDPALDEFGLEGFKMIDPACGSGHFLLGSFRRIEDLWEKQAPDAKCREVVQRTLDSIFGVDVNPFAVAIARFRLLLAALRTCGVLRLTNSPAFHVNVACGDSLYHGRQRQQMLGDDWTDEAHYFTSEDAPDLRRMLRDGTYHCVVANPPYITPKDRAANQVYRKLYPKTCHMKYSLAVPFMERIYRLAVPGGFTGQITANSFMKREFGKKLIEEFLPQIELTHIVDTSGAYIPDHATPTVILFGRHRKPTSDTIRTVMGIRGEPSTPDDPAHGLVWLAISDQIDKAGSQSEFVSVEDTPREAFGQHPWSVRGGGAAKLKERLEEAAEARLTDVGVVGVAVVTLEDGAFQVDKATARRSGVCKEYLRGFVVGDTVRDWQLWNVEPAFFPHSRDSFAAVRDPKLLQRFWPLRTVLANRLWFRKTMPERGMAWFAYGHISMEKFHTPMSIVYGEVATHNHFVLDRGGKVFNRTAPVIKLESNATEDDHLALLGLLNSSTACFWMKQVCFPKGTTTGDISKEKGKAEANRFAFNATAIAQLPVPKWSSATRGQVIHLTSAIIERAEQTASLVSEGRLEELIADADSASLRASLEKDRDDLERLKGEMVFLQEELDWAVYSAFGLIDCVSTSTSDHEMPAVAATSRPFCRRDAPAHSPANLRDSWAARCQAIEQVESVRLIETPVYKRLWSGRQGVYGSASRTTSERQRDVQRVWLLDCLEGYSDFDGRMNDEHTPTAKLEIALTTVAKLSDVARYDPQFMQVGEVYRDDRAFDVQRLVDELVQAENVPVLPMLRYKASGLRKRQEWERTWELQPQVDVIDARSQLPNDDPEYLTEDQARHLARREIGDIPIPPRYRSTDFVSTGGARYWNLRGNLDMPKERWVSFPHCEGEDGTLVIAWAGYDHLQLARAVSAYYVDIQERLGGRDDPRLEPLLACLIELLPWLKQWHNEVDPEFNVPMGDYFEGFIQDEARQMNKTVEEVRNWQPPKKAGRTRKRGAST